MLCRLLDPTVMMHHTSVSNCFNYVVTIAFFCYYRLICTECLCVYASIYKGRWLSNIHNCWPIIALPSLQSTMPIQTRAFRWGGYNTIQNKKTKAVHDPFKHINHLLRHLKGTVHSKITILSFIHTHDVLNLFYLLSFVDSKLWFLVNSVHQNCFWPTFFKI